MQQIPADRQHDLEFQRPLPNHRFYDIVFRVVTVVANFFQAIGDWLMDRMVDLCPKRIAMAKVKTLELEVGNLRVKNKELEETLGRAEEGSKRAFQLEQEKLRLEGVVAQLRLRVLSGKEREKMGRDANQSLVDRIAFLEEQNAIQRQLLDLRSQMTEGGSSGRLHDKLFDSHSRSL